MTADELIAAFRQALAEEWGYIYGTAGKEWTDELQKKLVNKMVTLYGNGWKKNSEAKDNNYYKGALYGSKWVGHMVADCSGLFVWAFQKLADKRISHSSHYQYTDYCREKGKLENGKRTDGKVLRPGTAVFVYKSEQNRYTHIGLYVGDGEVIEAASTEKGVTTSKVTNEKWNRWGEMKYVDFPETEAPAEEQPQEPADVMPTIRKGDKGNAVRMMQQALLALGYDLPRYGADGDFGAETEKAVKEFQKDKGLSQDGVVGRKTWAALEKAMEAPEEPKTYTVTISGLTGEQADELIKKYGGEKKED